MPLIAQPRLHPLLELRIRTRMRGPSVLVTLRYRGSETYAGLEIFLKRSNCDGRGEPRRDTPPFLEHFIGAKDQKRRVTSYSPYVDGRSRSFAKPVVRDREREGIGELNAAPFSF
jgi:hypothetical protein